MGWKRLEKEFKRSGKKIEAEGRRFVERASNELQRVAERHAERDADPAIVSPTAEIGEQPLQPIAGTTCEVSINPDNLKPGRAYIINHLSFNNKKLHTRNGSELDVERLQKIFLEFGLKVKYTIDATLSDVQRYMNKIQRYNFRQLSCLVIVIMSHGYENNIVAAKDGEYSLDRDIMYPILMNKSLTSKLKFVVTQACKGYVNPLFEIEGPRKRPTAIPSEILQVYSCVEGYVSYLDPTRGSPFIGSLCDHLEQSGLQKNILDIAKEVVADVKRKYCDIQIPMIHTNLVKHFVFGHYITENAGTLATNEISSDEELVTDEDLVTDEEQEIDTNSQS